MKFDFYDFHFIIDRLQWLMFLVLFMALVFTNLMIFAGNEFIISHFEQIKSYGLTFFASWLLITCVYVVTNSIKYQKESLI